MGAWKMRLLKHGHRDSTDGTSEGNKNSTRSQAVGHLYDGLKKNLAVSCLCPESLGGVELEGNGLIYLEEEM